MRMLVRVLVRWFQQHHQFFFSISPLFIFVFVSFVAGTVVSPVAAVAAVAAPVAAGSTSCEQFFTLRLFPMEEIRVPSVFALSVVVYCEVLFYTEVDCTEGDLCDIF